MHVLNNFLAFGLALAFADIAARSTRPAPLVEDLPAP